MKVALAIAELTVRGGTHKQLLRLAQYLERAGHEVVIITHEFDVSRTYPEFASFDIRTVPVKQGRSRVSRQLHEIRAARNMVRALPRDCTTVNIHDNALQLFHLILRRSATSYRIIWQVNDLPGYFKVGTGAQKVDRPWWPMARAFQRWVARTSDVITVNVGKNADRVRASMKASAKLLHCGVDLRARELRAHQPQKDGCLRLISVGVFLPYRNYEAILRAQKVLADQHGIDNELVIIGSRDLDPDYALRIEALAGEIGVACKIVGNVGESELQRYFDNSDIFLFVNIDQSWGLAVFEAMNMGLPVIVSQSVGATELLHAGVDAEIVDPVNVDEIARVIARLTTDSSLYQERAKAGFRATLEMTWDKLYSRPMEQLLLGADDARSAG